MPVLPQPTPMRATRRSPLHRLPDSNTRSLEGDRLQPADLNGESPGVVNFNEQDWSLSNERRHPSCAHAVRHLHIQPVLLEHRALVSRGAALRHHLVWRVVPESVAKLGPAIVLVHRPPPGGAPRPCWRIYPYLAAVFARTSLSESSCRAGLG